MTTQKDRVFKVQYVESNMSTRGTKYYIFRFDAIDDKHPDTVWFNLVRDYRVLSRVQELFNACQVDLPENWDKGFLWIEYIDKLNGRIIRANVKPHYKWWTLVHMRPIAQGLVEGPL